LGVLHRGQRAGQANVGETVGDALPCLNQALPRFDEVLPRLGEVLPRLDGVLPRLDGVLPRLDEALPRLAGDLPPGQDKAVPRLAGYALPRLDELSSAVEAALPDATRAPVYKIGDDLPFSNIGPGFLCALPPECNHPGVSCQAESKDEEEKELREARIPTGN